MTFGNEDDLELSIPTAYIESISNIGEVDIRFSESIVVPANWSRLNETTNITEISQSLLVEIYTDIYMELEGMASIIQFNVTDFN